MSSSYDGVHRQPLQRSKSRMDIQNTNDAARATQAAFGNYGRTDPTAFGMETGFSATTEEHALIDSHEVCVGAAQRRTTIPRFAGPGCQCLKLNVKFLADIEWAVRFGLGALLCALPAFVEHDWVKELVPGLDKAYAAVVFVFTFGFSIGETNKYIFQAMCGSVAASVVPQLAINTFGTDVPETLIFMFLYSLCVLALPIEATTKKFSLGLCIHFMMIKAQEDRLNGSLPVTRSDTYAVVLLGAAGAYPDCDFIPETYYCYGDQSGRQRGC